MLTGCITPNPHSLVLIQQEKPIEVMHEQLDDENTSNEVNRALLCDEYKRVYKTEYLSTLMKYDKSLGQEKPKQYYLDELNNTIFSIFRTEKNNLLRLFSWFSIYVEFLPFSDLNSKIGKRGDSVDMNPFIQWPVGRCGCPFTLIYFK